MTLCDDGHEEVCYEGRDCPVCNLKDELKDAEKEIEKLRDEIEGWNE